MKQFDKIWEESGLGVIDPDDDYGGCLSKEDAEMIFRATMLAAADIAERMYFHHTPDDGVISGDGIAAEIRKRAE